MRVRPFAIVFFASGLSLADSRARFDSARADIDAADRELPTIQAASQTALAQAATPEQRLANGEVLLRLKQYDAAVTTLTEVTEGYPDTRAFPDALWLRSEAFYNDHQYLAARRDLRKLVDRSADPRFTSYQGRALSRLIDVSIRIGDVGSLDDIFAKLSQIPPSQVDEALQYARGKAHYFRKEFAQAETAFKSIPVAGLYGHQARYFQGLVALRQAQPVEGSKPGEVRYNYKPAIEVFRTLTEMTVDSPDNRHVVDLGWMAIARLLYETDQFEQAADAYGHIDRSSPEFATMLYEVAWVYVRAGDVIRAERALEVLSVSDPNASFIGDGALLRADLLLRKGSFAKALEIYEGVRAKFEPMHQKVDTFLSATRGNLQAFYEKLSSQQMDALQQSDELPPLALRWAREGENGERAFAILEDVARCRKLIKESESLVSKLIALSESSNRVRAFPELLAGEKKAIALINRIAHARLEIAKGLDEEESPTVTGEFEALRNRRRELMKEIEATPVTEADFAFRDQAGTEQWNGASQKLSQSLQEVDQLQAVVNGLRRMLSEDQKRGIQRPPTETERFRMELDTNERELRMFTAQAVELRKQVEIGRAQIGLGDSRFQHDAAVREEFRGLVEREVQLAQSGVAGGNAQRYSGEVATLLANARAAEDRLVAEFNRLDEKVVAKVSELRAKIDAESAKIAGFQGQLNGLDDESRELVGRVAERNFILVGEKLRSIVLRADVGVTEQAWEVREEELARVRQLQMERVREEQVLDEELREVLDDAGESAAKPEGAK